MIGLVSLSAVTLSLLQASITGPTDSFRGCLREAATRAATEKVTGDKIEGYLRSACTVQLGSLASAIVAFRMKNGMTRKAASADADMTVEDYVSTPADNYKYMINYNAPAQVAPASQPQTASAPASPTPAAQPH
jgi:hypothetical protein